MKLDEILDSLKIENPTNEKPITHTLMDGGKLHVPKDKLNSLYKKIVKHGIEKKKNVQLVERMGEFHPLVVDIDIKYKGTINDRQYTDETVYQIISFLWAKLTDYIDLEDKSNFGEIWIMEKDKPYPCTTNKQYKSKDGIHIAFPKIIIAKKTYKKLIHELKQEKQIEKIFNDTCTTTPDNEEDTLFDGCFTSWQPYGCGKKNESYYKLTKVFSIDEGDNPVQVDDDSFETYFSDNLTILKTMSMCYREKETIQYLPPLQKIVDKGLKNLTSSNTSGFVMVNNNDIYGQVPCYVDNNNIINPYKIVEEEELKLIQGLVTCLSQERASDYSKWLSVGLCLHNLNNDKLLPDWKKFSSQDESYDEHICDQKWNSFNNNHEGSKLGMGSLRWWAKNDDEKEYNKVLRKNLGSQIEKSIDKGPEAHHLLALVIHKYYENQFICVDINDDWYFFNGIRWKNTKKANELKTRIHSDIYNIYHEYSKDYKDKRESCEEGSRDYKYYDDSHSRCCDFQKKLLQENYVNTIIGALRHIFYKEDIMEDFDSNLDLIGFENGIYDLKSSVFREGRPEDYVTLSTKVSIPVSKEDLPLELDDLVPKMESIPNYDLLFEGMFSFISQIIPDEELRDYAMRFISKCMSGENRDEGFYIWTGSGGNGKSKLNDLIKLCLGQYACNLPVTVLTQKRKAAGSANPEMAITRGKRWVYLQEPDVKETLNVGEMKEITGNDVIQARALYKEPFEFVPQFKLIMMCNDLPKIPSNDDGTWRRLEAVPFMSRFVKVEDVDESNHRYLMEDVKRKLPHWVIPFLTVLFKEWRLYDTEGIHIPDIVKDKTSSYRNENDIVGQWITDQCKQADNELCADGVTESAPSELKNLYKDFKDWCEEEEVSKDVIPDKNKFKEALKKWQSKSKYGLKMGKRKTDKKPNGCESAPKFNLVVV